MTYKQKLINGLACMGWRLDTQDKSKYTAFTHRAFGYKLFVGTNGALRKGDCASRSYSIGDAARQTDFYKHVILQGEQSPYA